MNDLYKGCLAFIGVCGVALSLVAGAVVFYVLSGGA